MKRKYAIRNKDWLWVRRFESDNLILNWTNSFLMRHIFNDIQEAREFISTHKLEAYPVPVL